MAMLQLLANGLSEKQIAHKLGKNVSTTRVQIMRMRTRLGMNTLYQLVAVAVEEGWIQISSADPRPGFRGQRSRFHGNG